MLGLLNRKFFKICKLLSVYWDWNCMLSSLNPKILKISVSPSTEDHVLAAATSGKNFRFLMPSSSLQYIARIVGLIRIRFVSML